MSKPSLNRIRKLFIPSAFFLGVAIAITMHSMAAELLLTPPGLRPIKDPSLVIPAAYQYPNRWVDLPDYRDGFGNPSTGWSKKFVPTRRFSSDQSAWIFYRLSDLNKREPRDGEGAKHPFRFWPTGTTVVIESYKGNALRNKPNQLIEIDVMLKIETQISSSLQAFYPVNWTYARFNPEGTPSLSTEKVRQCHQCHGIAFHLTGDLIFTQFP